MGAQTGGKKTVLCPGICVTDCGEAVPAVVTQVRCN